MVQELGKNKNPGAGKKIRSRAYPALDLPAAILTAKKIFDDLGQGPHSRMSLARGLGYGSFCGAASAKIGALAHFGFLERFAGNYSVAPAALPLFDYPKNLRQNEIFAAAARPSLFAALAARFAGQNLPKNLPAVLVSDYGISFSAAPLAAKNFIATFEFAGMLKENRLILPDGEESENDGDNDIAKEMNFEEKNRRPAAGNNHGGGKEEEGIEVRLASGIRIVFPKKFAARLARGEFAEEVKSLDSKITAD